MDAVIRITMIQGILSVLFAVLVLVVVGAAVAVCIKAIQAHSAGTQLETTEEPDTDSEVFAPTGFIVTARDKEVQAMWDERYPHGTPISSGSH